MTSNVHIDALILNKTDKVDDKKFQNKDEYKSTIDFLAKFEAFLAVIGLSNPTIISRDRDSYVTEEA